MSRDNDAADPAATTAPQPDSGQVDLTHLRPDRLRIGGTGVLAGDWASYDPGSGKPWRVHVGLVGVLVDRWNGWAVFSCTREVAEAIVADQDRMRDAERAKLAAAGVAGDELTRRVDETIATMYFDGDDIVLDDRAAHPDDGDHALIRITPEHGGRYIVNGYDWTWTAVDPHLCDRIAGRVPPPGEEQEYVVLAHTEMRVPHDRLAVTSMEQMQTHNGVAFTAQLCLDGQPVGTVENTGNGGATRFYRLHSGAFTWRHLADYVAGCRHRGQPVSEEDVLNALTNEYDLAETVAQATAGGGTVARLLDEHGHALDLVAVRPAPATTADRAGLARRLVGTHPHPLGAVWQVWTGVGWRHLGPASAGH